MTDDRGAGLRYAEPLLAAEERFRFRRQWSIGPSEDSPREGWVRHALPAGKALDAHPDLRVTRVSVDGGLVWVLGLAVRPTATDPTDLGFGELSVADPSAIESAIYGLAGQYVVIVVSEKDGVPPIRIYTDPGAMMQVYYDASGRLASTPSLFPGVVRDEEVDREYPLRGTDDWYPGSLCPYVGIRSLIANHVLDVEAGTIRRFWPTTAPEAMDAATGITAGGAILSGMMRGFVESAPVLLSLTGGRDSRVNLAAARDLVDRIETFTIRSPKVKRCDLDAPAAMAERWGLDHRFVDVVPADPSVVALYDEISADMALGSRREILGACAAVASSQYVHVSGNLGAITKSFFWPSSRPKSVSLRALMKEFINKAPCVRRGVEEWRATVPELPPTLVYNLMYLEQRGGRWMGTGENAANLFYEPATPFCSRELFETVCAMPPEVQHGGTLLVDYVRELWPELLDVPYCPVTRNWGTYLPKGLKARIKRVLGRD